MPDAGDDKSLAKRVDADGNVQVGPNWDTLIERQIREAMESGKFKELPHQGKPLPNDENPHAGDQALAFHILKNAGVAPPWIEANKEANELLAKRDAILERAASGSRPSIFAREGPKSTNQSLKIARAIASSVKFMRRLRSISSSSAPSMEAIAR